MRRRGVLACTRGYTLTPLCLQLSKALRPPAVSTKTPLREPWLPPPSTGPLLPAVRRCQSTPKGFPAPAAPALAGPCNRPAPLSVHWPATSATPALRPSSTSRRYHSHLPASRRFHLNPLAGTLASTTFHQPLRGFGLLPLAGNPSGPPLSKPSFRSRLCRRLDRRPTYLPGVPTCTLGRLPAFRSPQPAASRPPIA